MQLEQIYLYRMTHIDNIPHILQYGITHRTSPNANPDFKSIGDSSLISHRKTFSFSINGVTHYLGDFIPFYFGKRMPMLYVIQHGGNFVPQATNPEDIVYIVVPLSSIIQDPALEYFFTDGHATDALTQVYDKQYIQQLPSLLNWEAIRTIQWGGSDNLDTKRAMQAEFLVSGDIPVRHIIGYVCYNEAAKQKLLGFGTTQLIKIARQSYY